MIVIFDPDEFRSFYPKFTKELVTDAELNHLFQLACTFIDNTDEAMIPYNPDKGIYNRKEVLYLFVCHMATMNLWEVGQSGAVQSASQGTVSVSYAIPQNGPNGSWFNQTPCGRTLWMLLKPYALGGRIFTISNHHPFG